MRAALQKGERVYGVGLEGYGQPRWPRFFSRLGLDFVFIDSEHTPIDRLAQSWALQAYSAYNIAPLLRIPQASSSLAAQALDAGAQGIVVPYVETAEEVSELVGAVRYRPFRGQALPDVLRGKELPSEDTKTYLDGVNADNLLIIMIESQKGLDNLESILHSGGVDAVLIGPNDISISLGIPDQFNHAKFSSAVQRTVQICRRNNVGVGVHFTYSDISAELQWIDWGCNLIVHLTDTLMIARGISEGLQALRDHTGDTFQEPSGGHGPKFGGHTV